MWSRFTELGSGQAPQTGFPGAAAGRLRPWERWRLIEKATMAYGYGLSVSVTADGPRLYLLVFARNGDMVGLTLIVRITSRPPPGSIARKSRRRFAACSKPQQALTVPRRRWCRAIA